MDLLEYGNGLFLELLNEREIQDQNFNSCKTNGFQEKVNPPASPHARPSNIPSRLRTRKTSQASRGKGGSSIAAYTSSGTASRPTVSRRKSLIIRPFPRTFFFNGCSPLGAQLYLLSSLTWKVDSSCVTKMCCCTAPFLMLAFSRGFKVTSSYSTMNFSNSCISSRNILR